MSEIGRGLEPPRDGIKEEADPGRSATLPGSFRQVSVSRTVAPCRRRHLPIPFPQRRVQCSSFVGTRNGHKRRAGFRVTSAPPFRVSPNRQIGVVVRTPIQVPPPPSSHPLHLELRGSPPPRGSPHHCPDGKSIAKSCRCICKLHPQQCPTPLGETKCQMQRRSSPN